MPVVLQWLPSRRLHGNYFLSAVIPFMERSAVSRDRCGDVFRITAEMSQTDKQWDVVQLASTFRTRRH